MSERGNKSFIFIALSLSLSEKFNVISIFLKYLNLIGLRGYQDASHAYRLIISVTILRVVYLFIFPLGLVGDESYYWEWGRNLDWGYYSKPPLIGWLMGAMIWLGINGASELRVIAALFGGMTTIFVFNLGSRLFNQKVAFWAAIFLLLTPAISAVSLIISIDAPLLFLWSLSMLAFWKVFYEKNHFGWIIILILSLGLGNLTKQMMLLFPLLGAVTLLYDPSKRYLFLKPWIWLGWVCTLFFLLPPILWNWSNDWITIKHTASHINQNQFTIRDSVINFFEFLLSESFIVGPILFFAGIYSLYKFSRSKNKGNEVNFLLIFSLPPLLFFLVLSFTQKVNPNWPAVFYLPMILLCSYHVTKINISNWCKKFRIINLVCSIILLAILYLSVFSIELFGLSGSKYDLFKRLRGYEQYAQKVTKVHESISKENEFEIIVFGHRYDLCQLAFAGKGQPKVYGYWKKGYEINDQYDIWAQKKVYGIKNALIVCSISEEIPTELINKYEKVEKLEENIRITFPVGKQHLFDLYKATSKISNKD